ncbi:MAG: hypothetical protein SFY95_07565 [Planctomycetota bacterium]|nr:hypothetical protein [Planctomycetota bacterium]
MATSRDTLTEKPGLRASEVVARFVERKAVGPDAAQRLENLGLANSEVLRKLLKRHVIRKARDGGYYLDRKHAPEQGRTVRGTRGILSTLLAVDAIDRESAVGLAEVGIGNTDALRGLMNSKVVQRTADSRYFVDEDRAQSLLMRPWYALGAGLVVLSGLLLWLSLM